MRIFFVVIISFLLSSCIDEFFEDCWDWDGPQFNQDSIPAATLNQSYRATITASIQNNSSDDHYEYDIKLKGGLPEGLSYYIDSSDARTVVIEGTPVVAGTFRFNLKVEVSDPYLLYDEDDDLCFHNHEQEYTLYVNWL